MKRNISLLISLFFIVPLFAQPVIYNFSPGSGPVGTSVTIKGKGFNSVPANNLVYFGAVRAQISGGNDTVLQDQRNRKNSQGELYSFCPIQDSLSGSDKGESLTGFYDNSKAWLIK